MRIPDDEQLCRVVITAYKKYDGFAERVANRIIQIIETIQGYVTKVWGRT